MVALHAAPGKWPGVLEGELAIALELPRAGGLQVVHRHIKANLRDSAVLAQVIPWRLSIFYECRKCRRTSARSVTSVVNPERETANQIVPFRGFTVGIPRRLSAVFYG